MGQGTGRQAPTTASRETRRTCELQCRKINENTKNKYVGKKGNKEGGIEEIAAHHRGAVLVELRLEVKLLSQLLARYRRVQPGAHRKHGIALPANLHEKQGKPKKREGNITLLSDFKKLKKQRKAT